MRLVADHVRVSVPATAGNLGPGFDALGMALGVRDEIEVTALASADVVIEIEGDLSVAQRMAVVLENLPRSQA